MSAKRTNIIECLNKREDIFRTNHPELAFYGRGKPGKPTQLPPEHDESERTFNPDTISIDKVALNKLSCQLIPRVHGELLRLYPLGTPDGRGKIFSWKELKKSRASLGSSDVMRVMSGTVGPDFVYKNGIKFLGEGRVQEPKRLLEKYNPSVDAAIMMRDVESALHASGVTANQFKNSTTVSASHPTQETDAQGASQIAVADNRSVPTLFTLAQHAAAPEIAKRLIQLENNFVGQLGRAHTEAKAGIDNLIFGAKQDVEAIIQNGPEMQKIREIETELREVHNRLNAAKKSLNKKRDEVNGYYQAQQRSVQDAYDATRAEITADYIEERDNTEKEFRSAYFGLCICKRCVRPFEPYQRASLPGWKRCSVVGCTSAERYCLDCSSAPCPRCYAPICAAHECTHEFECRVQLRCGLFNGSIFKGIEAGCCGEATASTVHCKRCSVQTCQKCRINGHCPSCHMLLRNGNRAPVAIPWGSEEYGKERSRIGLPTSTDRRGAYGSVRYRGQFHHFIETDPPMTVQVQLPVRALKKKRERDEEVLARFKNYKRQRKSSKTPVVLRQPTSFRIIKGISFPRIPSLSCFGITLQENGHPATRYGAGACRVIKHFPLERSHSLLVEKDFILAVNGTRVFDVGSGVALLKFKEITSLIGKTDEGADLVLDVVRFDELQTRP